MTTQGASPSATQVIFGILNGLVNAFSNGGLVPVQQGLRGSPQVIFQNAQQLSTILGRMGVLNDRIGVSANAMPTIWNGQSQQGASRELMNFQHYLGQAQQRANQMQILLHEAGHNFQNVQGVIGGDVAVGNKVVGTLAAHPIGGQVMAQAAATATALTTMQKLSVLWRLLRASGQAMMAIGELRGKTGANDDLFQLGRVADGMGDAGGTITRTVIPALGNLFGPPPPPTPPPPSVPLSPPPNTVPWSMVNGMPPFGGLNPAMADPNLLAQQQQIAAYQQYAAQQAMQQQYAAQLAMQQQAMEQPGIPQPYLPTPGGGSGWIPTTPPVAADLAAAGVTGGTSGAGSATGTGGGGDDRVVITVGDFDNDGDSEVRFELPKEKLDKDISIEVTANVDGKEVKGRLDIDAK
jgi:hypothetical protein